MSCTHTFALGEGVFLWVMAAASIGCLAGALNLQYPSASSIRLVGRVCCLSVAVAAVFLA